MVKSSADTSARIMVLENQVGALATEVNNLETKIDTNNNILHDKISEIKEDFHSKISEMKEDFHRNADEKHQKLVDKLDDQARASSAQHAAISQKIQTFEKWRWMVMGAAIVAGYILAHIKLEKLF